MAMSVEYIWKTGLILQDLHKHKFVPTFLTNDMLENILLKKLWN